MLIFEEARTPKKSHVTFGTPSKSSPHRHRSVANDQPENIDVDDDDDHIDNEEEGNNSDSLDDLSNQEASDPHEFFLSSSYEMFKRCAERQRRPLVCLSFSMSLSLSL